MPPRALIACLPLLALTTSGCDRRLDKRAVIVSAIGGPPGYGDVDRRPLDSAQRLLITATAQGLVQFDAAGQIEPGLAERWIVIDQGRSYIFRLREAEWADGKPVTAGDVVKILRRAIDGRSKNPLKPFLSAIGEIKEMTPRVIEIDLARPRPDLLKLFAQPELAILRPAPAIGSGPFRVLGLSTNTVALRPAFDPGRSPDEETGEPGADQDIALIGERAARAITRFRQRRADLVLGGGFDEWPLLAAAGMASANIRLDPAPGLFGLAVVNRAGLLEAVAGRAAIAGTIDRAALLAAFRPDWPAATRLLPDQLDSAAAPGIASWSTLSGADALTAARQQVAAWRGAHPGPIILRLALPAGPGGTLLFAHLAARWRLLGIGVVRVAWTAPADLRLIDAVAPYDSARWYLATACQACSPQAMAALDAAREAPTMADRARDIAEADAVLTGDVAFIPIAQPLRWSLVAPRLDAWQGNPRAWHPLNRLRADTR
ncbi:ABC transporter substrate-binding protein [uncultured Sphingomonas sp.]|uniref:ABC transporter substrate-binding protein n=1 Tax=uncultured Sphingomonas sp. TaxID=158754 RepID=UPI0035C95A44